MKHDENLSPWIQELEAAVKPYLQFVDQVAVVVSDLEPRVMEMLNAPPVQAPAQVLPVQNTAPTLIGIEPEKFQALERELADQVLIRKSQQTKIEELKMQLAAAAAASSNSNPEIASSENTESLSAAVASASAMDLEKFLALEKESAEQIAELQTQITLLKTALLEVKAQAVTAADAASVAQATLIEAKAEISRLSHFENDASTVIESVSKRREPRAPSPKFPERHVLLVDDAEINRVLMSHYFKGLPVKLEFAVSVNAAVEKCKDRRFDLIVIDDELVDLENPILRSSTSQIVGLSNRAGGTSSPSRFDHILNRGQAREAFVEQLKGFLWDAERIA